MKTKAFYRVSSQQGQEIEIDNKSEMRDIIIPVIQCEQRDKGSWMEDRTEVPDESIPDLLTPLTAKLRFKYKPKINFIWRGKKKQQLESIYSATQKKKKGKLKWGKNANLFYVTLRKIINSLSIARNFH